MLFEIYPQDPLFRCLLYPGHHEHLCWRSHRYNPGKSIKNMWVTFAFLRKQIQIACTIRKTSGAIISTASAFSTEHPALITRKPSPTTMIIIHKFNDHHDPIPSQGKETQVAVSSVAWTKMWVNHSHTFRQNKSYHMTKRQWGDMTCYNFMDQMDIFYKIYHFWTKFTSVGQIENFAIFILFSSEIYQFILQII